MARIISDLWKRFLAENIVGKYIYVNVAVFVLFALLDVFATLFNMTSPALYLKMWLELPSAPMQFVVQPWSLVTYMFLHAGLMHILWNMLALYWFGKLFLSFFSTRHFIGLYFLGGIAGGLFFMLAYTLSNVIMVGVIWLLYRYFEKRKITALIGSALGIICILLCGSRNALLAIVAYVVAKTVIKLVSKSTPNGERWLYTVWSAALLLFFLFFDTAISLAARLLSFLGIYSRSIGLLGSDLFYDSGRSLIHSDLINALNERPLLGLGIGGDMAAIDWPAHNFYLSVLSTYGYLLGAILLVIFGAILWLAFRKSNAKTREILFIYVCLLIPRSFTGNDIWRSDIPWWMLTLCLVAISNPTKEEPSALSPDLVDGAEEGSESGAPLASPSLN